MLGGLILMNMYTQGLRTDIGEGEEEASTDDLRRGGLCLVPMSWASCIMLTLLDASSNHPFYF